MRVLILLLGLWMSSASVAANKVALVIGNAKYLHTRELTNPLNDGADIAAALARAGFDVQPLVKNATKAQMDAALREFASAASGAAQAVVYFAGHGVEANGENYLVPIEAQLLNERTVSLEAVKLSDVMNVVSGATELGLVVLDACRNNPLAAKMARIDSKRADSRGFVPVEPRGNLLVAYAAEAGSLASDGSGGRNSPFTAAVLQALQKPPMEVRIFWGHVRDAVLESTGGEQRPFTYGTLGGRLIYLAGGDAVLQRPSPEVAPNEGELRIEVVPPNARVRVEGALIGSGSQTMSWKAGAMITVRAEADGFEALEENVWVRSGQVADVLLRLTAKPSPTAASPAVQTSTAVSGLNPQMVTIPSGTFVMGSPKSEEGRLADEGPLTTISVTSFRLAKYEVTVGEFRRFVDATGYRTDAEENVDVSNSAGRWQGQNPGCRVADKARQGWAFTSGSSWRDPGFEQSATHPVVCVSWRDAQAYIKWLNRETGKRYRLPSEAEQEYAIRAGSKSPYAWGTDANEACRFANVADQSGPPFEGKWSDAVTCNDGSKGTSEVGRHQVNTYGLYDTVGNALEWGEDCYQAYPGGSRSSSAVEVTNCERRVKRGAAFDDRPAWLRSAVRDGDSPEFRHVNTGFRLAEDL